MKIRKSFVSNSSSCSFIVFIPQNTETINSEEEYKTWTKNEYYWDDNDFDDFGSTNLKMFNKNWKKGLGLISGSVDHGTDISDFEELMKKMGGVDFTWED